MTTACDATYDAGLDLGGETVQMIGAAVGI